MFAFLKKKDMYLYAPVKGECIALDEVPDQVFASKMMGDGIAFKLKCGNVFAPCNGRLTFVAETLHAFGFTSENGIEILLHIGLNTVELKGKGFRVLKKQGEKVLKGDLIAEVDIDYMKSLGIDLISPMIIVNHDHYNYKIIKENGEICSKESAVIELFK